jgi:hypothetical protein
MNKPKVGERFTAFFGGIYDTSTVEEWRGNKCFFTNGWYLRWVDGVGFL